MDSIKCLMTNFSVGKYFQPDCIQFSFTHRCVRKLDVPILESVGEVENMLPPQPQSW